MLINHHREKLVQAVLYFASNTRNLGKTKLFKLLYFLDFEHFRDTGRSVTGLHYFAWPKGPVPKSLFDELSAPEADWQGKVAFQERQTRAGSMLAVEPLATFDASHFTKRELRLLEKLATEFRDSLAEAMVEETHLENQPWHKVYVTENRKQKEIPYQYAIRGQEVDAMSSTISERNEFIETFKPT
ncbi:Panacea domain-containing protein [Chitinimonas viridis]|uniref:Panacea domain-containing protein n=1 Tax=Chitinimonas viridis TaxID=664880 RepID=A0ABT8B7M2_9NEIS|nr:Panacea domain-containing protein [Chitinimonas viridis]MDN3578029.1 Panacea domain-containing protein [Chitinimonas viridis]